ncbi:MAG: glycosyltransferase family 1 protein [Brachymonas sp.]|nr:glycosyltransferase family 1 protein [Brachymonas sp.]
MHILLSNVGSAGDAHPFIALGAALLAAGHQVSMASHDEHQAEIEAARIEFISLGQDLSYQQAIDNPNLWHSIKGMGVLWRNLLAPSIVPLYRLIESLQLQGRAQMVIAAPQMLGARLAQEHLSSRYLSAYTAPNMLRTNIAPTSIAHWHLPKGMPRWCVRALWQAIDHYKLVPMARKAMAHTGEALNLPMPPVQDIFSSWMHSSLGSLALFPDWYGAAAPDWPARPAYAGFPLYDLDARQALSPELEDFLNAGPPPVVVMPGSANQFGQADFAAWLRVLSRKGLRGVFIGANSALTEASASAFLAVQSRLFLCCCRALQRSAIMAVSARWLKPCEQVLRNSSGQKPMINLTTAKECSNSAWAVCCALITRTHGKMLWILGSHQTATKMQLQLAQKNSNSMIFHRMPPESWKALHHDNHTQAGVFHRRI